MTQASADGHGQGGDHHGHGPVGPLVDEAALLLTAVEDKLQAWQAADVHGPVEPPRPCPECGTVPGAACTGCPVCRLIAAVRGERPEVTARMVDGALTIVRALRTLLPDAAAGPEATGPDPAAGPDAAAPAGPPPSPPADGPVEPGSADPADPGRAHDRPDVGQAPPRPGVRRPGPTPPRPAPRIPRPTGLQRIDIS